MVAQLGYWVIRRAYLGITCKITCSHVKKPSLCRPHQSADRPRQGFVLCSPTTKPFSLSSKEMGPVINKTLTALAVAGVGALAYAVYFDHRRRTDTKFRKQLRTSKFVFVGPTFQHSIQDGKRKRSKSLPPKQTRQLLRLGLALENFPLRKSSQRWPASRTIEFQRHRKRERNTSWHKSRRENGFALVVRAHI